MTETIQHFIDLGDKLTIYCHNPRCNHHAVVDMLKLRDKLGPDHGCLHDDIIHMFRCSKCGGKELGLIRSPSGNSKLDMRGAHANKYERESRG